MFDIFSKPAEEGPDPFERRPTLIFQATPTELGIWGTMSSLGFVVCCGCLVGFVASLNNHNRSNATAFAVAVVVTAALIWHSFRNPPCSVGLNVETQKYKLVKGAGRFKRIFYGTFDDIEGVESYVVEDSRGITGFNVAVRFKGKLGRCDVERLDGNTRAKAQLRAERLAGILGVRVAEPKAK